MTVSFGKRLKRCALRAALGVSDLQWFFDRDYKTVREWILREREPEDARREDALSRLAQLEVLVSTKDYFPMPLWAGKRKRSAYMRLLGGGSVSDREEFFASDLAKRRPVHRASQAAKRKTPTKSIRND